MTMNKFNMTLLREYSYS